MFGREYEAGHVVEDDQTTAAITPVTYAGKSGDCRLATVICRTKWCLEGRSPAVRHCHKLLDGKRKDGVMLGVALWGVQRARLLPPVVHYL